MAEAIHYCHLNNISHGDLKPENLMYLNKSEDSPIKIIDFGFSADKSNQNNPICGTSYYMSPELRAFKQDPLADVWAMVKFIKNNKFTIFIIIIIIILIGYYIIYYAMWYPSFK